MKIKNQKGITLVALVVTLIILLILAGVTIGAVLGDNGLINKTKIAKEKYENAQALEKNDMNELANQIQENLNSDNQNSSMHGTAISSDILKGKTAWVDGEMITGTFDIDNFLKSFGIYLIFYDGQYYNTDLFTVNICSGELKEDKTILTNNEELQQRC